MSPPENPSEEWTEEVLEKFVMMLLPRRKHFEFQRGSDDHPRVFIHRKELYDHFAKKMNITLPQFDKKLKEFNALYYKHLYAHMPLASVSSTTWCRVSASLPRWLRHTAMLLIRDGSSVLIARQRRADRARKRALSSGGSVLGALVECLFGACAARCDSSVPYAHRVKLTRPLKDRMRDKHVMPLWKALLCATLNKLCYLLCEPRGGAGGVDGMVGHERRVADVLLLCVRHEAMIEPRLLDHRAGEQLSLLVELVEKYQLEDENTPLERWKDLLHEYAASARGGYASCVLLQRRWCALRRAARAPTLEHAHRHLYAHIINRFPHIRSTHLPTWWEMLDEKKVLILDPKDDGLDTTQSNVEHKDDDDDLILIEKAVETVEVDDNLSDDDLDTHKHTANVDISMVKHENIDTSDGKSNETKILENNMTPSSSELTSKRNKNGRTYGRKKVDNNSIVGENIDTNAQENNSENVLVIRNSLQSNSNLIHEPHNTENIDKSTEIHQICHETAVPNDPNNTKHTTNDDPTSKANVGTSDVLQLLSSVDPVQVQTSIIFDSDSDSDQGNLVIDTMSQRDDQEDLGFSNDAPIASTNEFSARISELVDTIIPTEQYNVPIKNDISGNTNTARNRGNLPSQSKKITVVNTNPDPTSKTVEVPTDIVSQQKAFTKDGEDAEMHEPNNKDKQVTDANDDNISIDLSHSTSDVIMTDNSKEISDKNIEMQEKSNVNIGESSQAQHMVVRASLDDDDENLSLKDDKLTMEARVSLDRLNSTTRRQKIHAQQYDINTQQHNLTDTNKTFDEVLSAICKPVYVVLKRDRYIDELSRERARQRVCKRVELASIEEVRRINRSILTAQVKPLSCRKPSKQQETVSDDADGSEVAPPQQPPITQSQSDEFDLQWAAEAIRSSDRTLQTLLKRIIIKDFDSSVLRKRKRVKKTKRKKKRHVRKRSPPPEPPLPDAHDEWIRQKNISRRYFTFGQIISKPLTSHPQTKGTKERAHQTLKPDKIRNKTNSEGDKTKKTQFTNFKVFVQTPGQEKTPITEPNDVENPQETLPQLSYRNESPYHNNNFFNRQTSKTLKRKMSKSGTLKKKAKNSNLTDEKLDAAGSSKSTQLHISDVNKAEDSECKVDEGTREQQDKTFGLDEWNKQKTLNAKYFTLPNISFPSNVTKTASAAENKTDQKPTTSETMDQSKHAEPSNPIEIESDETEKVGTEPSPKLNDPKPEAPQTKIFLKNVLVKSFSKNEKPIFRLVKRESSQLPANITQTQVNPKTNTNVLFNTNVINNTYTMSQKVDYSGPLLSQNLVFVADEGKKGNFKTFKIVDSCNSNINKEPSVKHFTDNLQSDVSLTPINRHPMTVTCVTDKPIASFASFTPPFSNTKKTGFQTLCVKPSLTTSPVAFTMNVTPSKLQKEVADKADTPRATDEPVRPTMTIPVMPALTSLSVISTVTTTVTTTLRSIPVSFAMMHIPFKSTMTATPVTSTVTALPVISTIKEVPSAIRGLPVTSHVTSEPVTSHVTSEPVTPQAKVTSMPVTVTSFIGNTSAVQKPAVLEAKGVGVPVTVTALRLPVTVTADSSPVITRVTSLREVVDLVSSDEEETTKNTQSEPLKQMFQLIFRPVSVGWYLSNLTAPYPPKVICIDRTVTLWTVDARYLAVTDSLIPCRDYTYWATGFKGKLIRLRLNEDSRSLKEGEEEKWGDKAPVLKDGKVVKNLKAGVDAQVLTQVRSALACAGLRASGVSVFLYDTQTTQILPTAPGTECAKLQ